MRVLVTGSHGLIGGALVERLHGDGDDVVALVRPASPGHSTPPAAESSGRATWVAWDPRREWIDEAGLDAAGPFDAVVHLAGAGIADRRWTPRRRGELVDTRVRATGLLVEALGRLHACPPVLVSGSAIGYYGERVADVLDEDSAPGTGFLAGLCRSWESEAQRLADRSRVVCLRTGVVLSTRGGALAKQLPLFRLGLGGRLGDGRQFVSWITLRDEIAVIRRAMDDVRIVGPVNATAPTPVTNAELTAALARALRRPAILPVPRLVLEAALGADLVAEAVLASQRVQPARLSAAGHRFVDAEIHAALRAVLSTGA